MAIFKSRVYRVTYSTCNKLLEGDKIWFSVWNNYLRTNAKTFESLVSLLFLYLRFLSFQIVSFFFFFNTNNFWGSQKKDFQTLRGCQYCDDTWHEWNEAKCKTTNTPPFFFFFFLRNYVDRHVVSFRWEIIAWPNDTLLMRIPLRMWCTLGARSPWKREPIKTDENLQKQKKKIRVEQT